jgi:glycosyltransferase involved in cell wall biosynthesis
MKILCVIQRFYPAIGGAENLMKSYLDYLSQNHEITVFTSNAIELSSFWNKNTQQIPDFEKLNYSIKRFDIQIPNETPSELQFSPFSISSLGPFCPEMWNSLLNLKGDFDLIIASSFPYDHIVPAFIAAKKNNIPIMILPHIHLEFPYLHFTSSKLTILENSEAIVVNTKEEQNQLIKYNISKNKIHIQSPGIFTNYEKSALIDIRKKLNISCNSTIVLFAGTKSYDKGIFSLLDSLKFLLNNNNQIDLILIGPSSEEFTNYLNSQSDNVKKHVFDLGIVNELEKNSVFNSCDMFVMPSKSESFGLVYLEAWLYKKPVIGCNIDAVKNLIDDNTNGFLVSFGDIADLVSKIEKLFDSNIRQQFGIEGHSKLLREFDLNNLCTNFEELCISLTKN